MILEIILSQTHLDTLKRAHHIGIRSELGICHVICRLLLIRWSKLTPQSDKTMSRRPPGCLTRCCAGEGVISGAMARISNGRSVGRKTEYFLFFTHTRSHNSPYLTARPPHHASLSRSMNLQSQTLHLTVRLYRPLRPLARCTRWCSVPSVNASLLNNLMRRLVWRTNLLAYTHR